MTTGSNLWRPEIEIIVPVQRQTAQLEKALNLLPQYTDNYKLTIVEEPDLNVSEARQAAMDRTTNDLICFIDDDSEMCTPGWLDMMYRVLVERQDAGAVTQGEWWGTNKPPSMDPGSTDHGVTPSGDLNAMAVYDGHGEAFAEVEKVPGACMLLDRRRLPGELKWDSSIGLRSGWLGGDFEEVDYCFRLTKLYGLKLYRATRAMFHHTGGKTTLDAFGGTDRFRTVNAMQMLLSYKYAKAPQDEDWFKHLKYVKARDDNDCMLAPGQSLRTAYHDVIVSNGLTHVVGFKRLGFID